MNNYETKKIILHKINQLIDASIIVPYDDYLLKFLATNTNSSIKEMANTNYFDSLRSNYSLDKKGTFSRYLALGMREPFKLCTGLFSVQDSDEKHTWIETEEFVYDVSFIGKYPKTLYYELFKPTDIETVDLEKDPDFKEYKCANVEVEKNDNDYNLKYFNWYIYFLDLEIYNKYRNGVPCPTLHTRQFPIDLNSYIKEEWFKLTSDEDITSELFSSELKDYILEELNRANDGSSIRSYYKMLIEFIVKERVLYEERKYQPDDETLYKKANASVCWPKFAGILPKILTNMYAVLAQIEENKRENPHKK